MVKKVIYAAGYRNSSSLQLERIVKNLSSHVDLRIAALNKTSQSLTWVDWIMDVVYKKPRTTSLKTRKIFNSPLPRINLKWFSLLLDDVKKYKPDLIISDSEPIFSAIARELDVELWYCSPVNGLIGIQEKGRLSYTYQLYNYQRSLKEYLVPGDKYLIYSPFYKFDLTLNPGFEWVKPFSEPKVIDIGLSALILDDDRPGLRKILKASRIRADTPNTKSIGSCIFCTGETSLIADALESGVSMINAIPNLKDNETLFNAVMIRNLHLGINIGQIELMKHYGVNEIERVSNLYWKINSKKDNSPSLLEMICK